MSILSGMAHASMVLFHFNNFKTGKKFKEHVCNRHQCIAFIRGCSKQHWLHLLHTPSHGACVRVFMCVLHFTPHGSTFSDITPAAPSLKVVDEHRNTVGPHQVVGVSGERLVLPAFWVTCGQTDGGIVSDNSCSLVL